MGKGYCGEEQCTHTYTRVKLHTYTRVKLHTYTRVKLPDWHYMSSSVAHFLVDRVSLNLEFHRLG